MIKRFGLQWSVPISEFIFEVEGEPLTIPYISPTNLMKYLLESHREVLLGGFHNVSDGVALLKGWWKHFQQEHPGHQVFKQHDSTALGYTIPLFLYGDEGKGKKRGNTAVFTVETPFGLNTSMNKREKKHCFGCTECCPKRETAGKFGNCLACNNQATPKDPIFLRRQI